MNELKKIDKDFQKLLDKHNAIVKINIVFPEYNVLPAEVQLALHVISKHTNKFVLSFVEEKEDGHKI